MVQKLANYETCDIFDEMFLQSENINSVVQKISLTKSEMKNSLSCSIKYLTNRDKSFQACGITFGFVNFIINDELPNKLSRKIAEELAIALDKNSVQDVKYIKSKYKDNKEFKLAKDYLNNKCKQVWDVFDAKVNFDKLPKQSMKILGITNQPSLEFLLENSLMYFEKDNGSTTIDIISLILKNKNMDYTFEDIFNYLKQERFKVKYNYKTVAYLLKKFDYDATNVKVLGISKETLRRAVSTFTIVQQIKYFIKNILIH